MTVPYADPTGICYCREDTEPAPVSVPSGVELWHFGRDVIAATATAETPVSQALRMLDRLSPADLAEVLAHYRPVRPAGRWAA